MLPIWALARRPGLLPDVLVEAFASLRGAPEDLKLEALLAHLADARARGGDGEPVALVVAEAIIGNRLAAGYPAVIDLLRATTNLNLCRYLALTAARAGDETLRKLLAEAREAEANRDKAAIFSEALGLRP